MQDAVDVAESDKGQAFVFCVDGVDYEAPRPRITAADIMEIAGVTAAQGLFLIEEDGTQRSVAADEVFVLPPRQQFRRKPNFRRG